jgi:hypothetical protein
MRPRAFLNRVADARVVSDSGAKRPCGNCAGIATASKAQGLAEIDGAQSQNSFATHGSPDWSFASTPVSGTLSVPRLQPKLEIGPVDDPLEREADDVAGRVLSGSYLDRPHTPGPFHGLQRKCAACNKEEEGEKRVSRKESGSGGRTASVAPHVVHDVLRQPGVPLDSVNRSFFERRFGYDFAGVRVHEGEKAAESARSVDALAYTVGRNIVFANGRYQPSTDSGRRLLAHELTHVVQQTKAVAATPCATLQRTPAIPEFKGVAGVRDLSRMTVDPIPDFVASSLTTARDINAHINDANVVHLSWELYGPADNLLRGFSTLPGNATSTSAPFSLDPATFSGPGFQAGIHLLRCVGRNAAHQPIVYADRDFNVLSSDLTTGTAKAGARGALTFTKYQKTDANPPGRRRYTVDVVLSFQPSSAVDCDDVAFMQNVESLDHEGRSQNKWSSSEKEARQTPLAWSVDQLAGVPSPFYIVNVDPVTHVAGDDPTVGVKGRGKPSPSPATLIDQPSWSRETSDRFESCAICRSGGNVGQVYGCATWGFTTTSAGVVTLMPRSLRDAPSDEFKEAKDAWNRWRTTKPAASRPAEAPALR